MNLNNYVLALKELLAEYVWINIDKIHTNNIDHLERAIKSKIIPKNEIFFRYGFDYEDIIFYHGSKSDLIKDFYEDGMLGEINGELKNYLSYILEAMIDSPYGFINENMRYCEEYETSYGIITIYSWND